MLTQKRHILTVAAIVTTLTMASGVGAVAFQADHGPAQIAHGSQVVTTVTTPAPTYVDDIGGGDR
ncbi:MAG TPA: hypothetical protein VGC71_07295 [Gaiellales bacterium]|jgi:hypothetical protein